MCKEKEVNKMTTMQIINDKINALEGIVRTNEEDMQDALEQIKNGVSNIDYCKKLIDQYDFAKEQIAKAESDLKILKLAIKAIEEEGK